MATAATPRPGRMLAIVGLVVLGLYLGLIFGPAQTPRLGLDLRGGTQVILTATNLCGSSGVSQQALDQAVDIIRLRVDAAGVGGATISKQGSDTIIVSAPGASHDQLSGLDQTALLRFRQVLGEQVGSPQPVPTPTTSVTGSPSPSATSGTKPKSKQSSPAHDVISAALLRSKGKGKGTPTPLPVVPTSPAPTNSPLPVSTAGPCGETTSSSATPTPGASGAPTTTPSPGAAGGGGGGGGAAPGTKPPIPNAASTDVQKVLQVFNSYDCIHGKDGNQPTEGLDLPQDYIVSCSEDGALKYLLAPAAVEGSQVSSAAAVIDTQTNVWSIEVKFTGSGQTAWYNLTKRAYESDPPTGPGYSPGLKCSQVDIQNGCNETAIVLDGVVKSAPYSNADGISGSSTQITGQFTQDTAKQLADVLKFGALPLKLVKQSEQSVSASLGSDQLRGGLIAGAIGLFLVILYSLLYYRALGIVTIASLALSGAILYAVTTLLGHSALGYTLSLPGIAGFIVAVGITADSFVVFFERLRDEVREGRRLRSAVERAWPRARRTIISADAVSLLAAVVLYIVSIGDVRGFAFTLGLSTLSDLFIVFFFTKPLLSIMARQRAFDAGAAWTGIGRQRAGVATEGEA